MPGSSPGMTEKSALSLAVLSLWRGLLTGYANCIIVKYRLGEVHPRLYSLRRSALRGDPALAGLFCFQRPGSLSMGRTYYPPPPAKELEPSVDSPSVRRRFL